jgi:23S rRNA (cytidine1920-2'-O)/16S rRNA (cytidine1409-2'-O)-methyltransferase
VGGAYVGRGGLKLKHAVDELGLRLQGMVAADFGCSVGGFTDCLLREGVVRVYAVDTGYGMLAWKLRQDPRVVVMERTNAMHVQLPEPVDIVTCDVAWTRQRHVLPNALKQLRQGGTVLSLFKPQYEAPARMLRRGRIVEGSFDAVLADALAELARMGIEVREAVRLPQERSRKNPEAILCIRAQDCRLSAGAAQGEPRQEGPCGRYER